ncbi:type IV secretion system protein [Novosphingobium aquae]|uniref:Type IV secretion system protein n=1 Tax=Novosphingobium aquae TaxID=3133435 RepID=A0ABU8SE51_9SPHN
MQVCAAFDPLGPYVGNVVAYADCQTLSLGEAGFRALGYGSPFGTALTGLLTIYVALIGYRLLMGSDITIHNTLSVALRLGIVVALATQWSAYRVLVFDVATKVPQELATTMLGQAGLASQDISSLTSRIDGVRSALEEAGQASVTSQPGAAPQAPPIAGQPALGSGAAAVSQTANASPQPAPEISGSIAVGTLAITALAGLLSVRVPMALLLALGPVFIAFLLFDGTRGLFNSWVRGLAGTVIGALAVPAVLALELAIIEPQVLALRDLVTARESLGSLPLEILATTGIFALVMLAALAAAIRAATGFRLPSHWWRSGFLPAQRQMPQTSPSLAIGAAGNGGAREFRDRAQRVADAAQALDWRDLRLREEGDNRRPSPPAAGSLASRRETDRIQVAQPLGQSGRRSTRRTSSGAIRRDGLT